MIFPEIFITGKLPENYNEASLCADGLMGWAICSSGTKTPIPEKFGEGMVAIGQRLGITATGDNLMKYADKFSKRETKTN